jgi:uncharacterized protein (TIGR00255 family)
MEQAAFLASMTGFSRSQGEVDGTAWIWELRSVNGRGLEVKLRLPSGFDALEPGLRDAAGKVLKRGNVSGTLTVRREVGAGFAVDFLALERLKDVAIALADEIPGALPPRAELLLGLPGVMRAAGAVEESEESLAVLRAAVAVGFAEVLEGLASARVSEGARLVEIVLRLLDEIAGLHEAASIEAAAQPGLFRARLMAQLSEILEPGRGVAEERVAQEIALLTTKSDVREELDRLGAHIFSARALVAEAVGVGRKLDFLMQEFNREVNTLCSKSASLALTGIGLKMKAVVEQLREQVQNIE